MNSPPLRYLAGQIAHGYTGKPGLTRCCISTDSGYVPGARVLGLLYPGFPGILARVILTHLHCFGQDVDTHTHTHARAREIEPKQNKHDACRAKAKARFYLPGNFFKLWLHLFTQWVGVDLEQATLHTQFSKCWQNLQFRWDKLLGEILPAKKVALFRNQILHECFFRTCKFPDRPNAGT